MKRSCLLAAVCALLISPWAHSAPPTVSVLSPLGVRPGQTVDLTLHGAELVGPTGFWTSFPAKAELTPGNEQNGKQPNQVSYRLTIPPECPLGVAALRVGTGQGISNLKLVLVDDLPSVAEAGSNKTRETAQAITPPVAVDGACEPESSDYYKFTAAAGQRLSVELFARRLGSPLDPAIRLLAADGRELAFSDDEPSTGADGRFQHTFAAAGEYHLEIRDIRFLGGGHYYRLRVGDFPLPSVPYPVAVQKGTTANVELAGKGAELPSPVPMNVPADAPGNRVNVAAGYAPGSGSNWVTVLASDTPEQLEQEPNDAPEQSTPISLPGALQGRFSTRGDRDYFQFEAKKGQRLVFAGQTRTLGSPSDLFLRLYNADGGVLAEAEDSGPDEAMINFTFPTDGVYRLRVEDTNRRGGPAEVYRIAVAPYQPGFSLQAAAEKVDAPQNGVFVVKVTAARRDYNGPITLGVEGAGEGASVRNNIIPEGKPETTMHVTLGKSLTAGQMGQIKIFGEAKVGESPYREQASTLLALRAALSGLPYPPAVLDGTLGLGVGPVFPVYFNLAVPSPVVALTRAATPVNLAVQATRSNGFDDVVSLRVAGLPAGVAAKPAKIEKGKPDAAIELTAAQPISPGKYPIQIIGSASFQNQPQEFVLDSVVLEGPPLGISFAAAGPLAAGGKQKALLTFAGAIQPVAAAAAYESGVTRGAEGPRAPALAGFEADNRAASFSGLDKSPHDDRLSATLPTASTGDYSIELWIYNTRDLSLPNSPAISGYFFSRPGAAGAQSGDHLGIGGVESSPRDKLFFYNGNSLVGGRTTLAINAWHHVALVRTGDDIKVYLNGDANPEIHTAAGKNFASNTITLGTRADGFSPFQGRLDEVAFFDVPLSGEQVHAHFEAAKAAAPARDVVLKDHPLAYWRLDETEGAVAASVAAPHKRLVRLAWKNLPAGLTAPGEVLLIDAQDKLEIELAATSAVAPGKLEGVIVAATTPVPSGEFTAESLPAVVEVQKP